MDPKVVHRFLDQLEQMGEGMAMMSTGDGRLMACGERLIEAVRSFRVEMAPTKKDLSKVRIPGEDSYEVSCDD